MKSTYPLMILALLWNSACKHYPCSSRTLKSVHINYPRPVTDTIAKIVRCEHGSEFATRIDSTYVTIFHEPNPMAPYAGRFTYDGFSDVTKDYIITLLPSGTTHKVKDINYGNQTYSYGLFHGGGSGADPAVNCSYGYTIDDSVVYRGADGVNAAQPATAIEL